MTAMRAKCSHPDRNGYTKSEPILPAAPARFSTTTGWPSRFCRPLATMRVTVSTPPPAGTLTMILIGLLG